MNEICVCFAAKQGSWEKVNESRKALFSLQIESLNKQAIQQQFGCNVVYTKWMGIGKANRLFHYHKSHTINYSTNLTSSII